MKKVWQIIPQDNDRPALFTQRLAISGVLSRLVLNRGIFDPVDVEKFLFNSLYDLPNPYLLKDMDKTVKRIKQALQMKENIMILSDYDVDGLTSLTLLHQFFKMNNLDINWYLPHRIDEGYGISMAAVDIAIKEKTSLFISADCGITAYQEIARLKSSGCDVIVIDHHRPKAGSLPSADAIIDPWQEDCLYPDKDLAAVGLVFKVLQAIMGIESRELLDFLDLVCLGTVADVASLRGENRTLVKYGLKALTNTKRRGLIELCNAASLKLENITVRNIAFVLGPRLNAAGRIDSAEDAFSLLVTDDTGEAQKLALKLDQANKKRRQIEAEILKEADIAVDREVDFSQDKIILIKGKNWHPGVLGIVASKLADKYYRPSIVFSESEGILKGSGRSIPDFNIFQAVSECCDDLEEFGGHAAACGVTLKSGNWNSFKARMSKHSRGLFEGVSLVPRLSLDCELDFSQIDENLFRDLELLEPFGSENPEPLFLTSGVNVVSEIKLLARNFCKFWTKKGSYSKQVLYKAKNGEDLPEPGDVIDIAYTPSMDTWEGLKSVTLFLEDFRKSTG